MAVVIVAIPDERDRVHKVSSEKVPHLTMMYLGDTVAADALERIVLYVQHVAETTLKRFGLSVDRRGELGPDQADVLFFEKKYMDEVLRNILAVFMANRDIYEAYSSAEQHPSWIPHLTLGYPTSPAKEVDEDWGLSWVNFNKIAVWTGDYDGPEFILQEDSEMAVGWSATQRDRGAAAIERALAAMEKVDPEGDALQFGIKGMKWGVRRSKSELSADKNPDADPDAVKAVQTQAKIASAGTLNVVSSKDLQHLVDRIKLEQKYIDTTLAGSPTTQKGNSLLKKVLGNELKAKMDGKDGPLLAGYKAMKAFRAGKLKEAAEKLAEANKAKAASNASKAEKQRLDDIQKQRERMAAAAGKHPGPGSYYSQSHPNPAQRRTVYSERVYSQTKDGPVYNVTTLNAVGSASTVLSLPSRKKP